MAERLVIEIDQHPWPVVLLPWPTGVDFEVQAGGLGCYQMSLEGLALPLEDRDALTERLQTLHPGCARRITFEEADEIDKILDLVGVPLRVNRDRLGDSYEAWVHVQIVEHSGSYLSALGGKNAILTWRNCD